MNIFKMWTAFINWCLGFPTDTPPAMRRIVGMCREIGYTPNVIEGGYVTLNIGDASMSHAILMADVPSIQAVYFGLRANTSISSGQNHSDVLEHLLNRNRELVLVSCSVNHKDDGSTSFNLAYQGFTKALTTELFGMLINLMIEEANAFDSKRWDIDLSYAPSSKQPANGVSATSIKGIDVRSNQQFRPV